MLEAPHLYGGLHAIRDHTEESATRQRQHLPPLEVVTIYPPIKDERLSRPDDTVDVGSLHVDVIDYSRLDF